MRFPKRPAVILTKPFEGPGRAMSDTDLERNDTRQERIHPCEERSQFDNASAQNIN
jgi:hypothetical protein